MESFAGNTGDFVNPIDQKAIKQNSWGYFPFHPRYQYRAVELDEQTAHSLGQYFGYRQQVQDPTPQSAKLIERLNQETPGSVAVYLEMNQARAAQVFRAIGSTSAAQTTADISGQ